MAQQTINVGTGVETGDGEIFRSAWIKVNANFADLDTRLITLDARVGNLGNSAARNVGLTPGTVADGGDLANEISRAQTAEGTNATAISTETTRAKAAEAALQAAIGQATTSFAVNYTAQSLTSAQQLQARQNISAVASGDNVVLGNGSTATTQAAGDNTTKVATGAFVTGAITSYAGTVASIYLTQSSAASTYAPISAGMPPGAVAHFAMPNAPTGWLKANGAAVSRSTYAALFAAIGITFGAGDGSTTFNLPDLRGEFVRGFDDNRGIDTGRSFATVQAQNFPAHYHRTSVGFDGNAFYGWQDSNGYPIFGSEVQASATRLGVSGSVSSGARLAFTDSTPQYTGGENRPRNVALLACIKT